MTIKKYQPVKMLDAYAYLFDTVDNAIKMYNKVVQPDDNCDMMGNYNKIKRAVAQMKDAREQVNKLNSV